MPRAVDLTGQTFGDLIATEYAGSIKGHRYYYCTCACGNETLSRGNELKRGKLKSCGCSRKGRGASNFKHGGCSGTQSPEYTAWRHIRTTQEYVSQWSDYKQFFKDIGWRPTADHELVRHDIREPHGPNNTYWRHKNERTERANLGLADDFDFNIDDFIGVGMDTGAEATSREGTEVSPRTDWQQVEEGCGLATAGTQYADISR